MAPNIVNTTATKDSSMSAYAFNSGKNHHVLKPGMADSYQHPERFWVDYVMEASSKDHARVRL